MQHGQVWIEKVEKYQSKAWKFKNKKDVYQQYTWSEIWDTYRRLGWTFVTKPRKEKKKLNLAEGGEQ